MKEIFFIITLLILIFAIIFCYYLKTIFDRLEQMVDETIAGTLVESKYEESRLSKMEGKFYRFLKANNLAQARQKEEHDSVQELVSDISHQTKTPLSNITVYTELLKENMQGEDRILADRICFQTEKLKFLIQSLVKISRLENNIIQVHPKHENLHKLLDQMKELYQDKADQKGIELNVIGSSAYAEFDLKWTVEALGNIVDNALKYTQEHGSVEVKVNEYEMFVSIDVIDNGNGISEEEQAKIFTRFYRGEKEATQEGVGIGLYLAREIVTREGGYIKVKSAPEQGSKFSLFLKRA